MENIGKPIITDKKVADYVQYLENKISTLTDKLGLVENDAFSDMYLIIKQKFIDLAEAFNAIDVKKKSDEEVDPDKLDKDAKAVLKFIVDSKEMGQALEWYENKCRPQVKNANKPPRAAESYASGKKEGMRE